MNRLDIKDFLFNVIRKENIIRCYQKLKYKYENIYNEIIKNTSYLVINVKFTERLYHIVYDLYEVPICKNIDCNKSVKFDRYNNGYFSFCSSKCSKLNIETTKKMNETYYKKTGYKHQSQNPEVKIKKKKTSILNYGVDHHMKNENVKNKIKNTCIERYGVDNPLKNHNIYVKTFEKRNKYFYLKLLKILEYLNLELLDENYINNLYDHKWKCLKCGNVFIHKWDYIQQGYRCQICNKNINKSEKEKLLYEFIQSLNLKVYNNNRKIIKPYELDIYISSKKLAIEFDGLYWHSEKFKIDKNYHLSKTLKCENIDIRLIHIFEDEWIFKNDIVKSKIKQILGINNSERIHARKCKIKEILPKLKNKFLNKFHIQGEDRSNIKLGAFFDNELVSVMTFSKSNISRSFVNIDGIWELSRFCSNSNYHIPGIASKLLTYFKRNYQWKEIFSYADRRWSEGDLYYKIGFELISTTKPNYWYVKGLNRIHRFGLRKKYNEPKDIPEWVLRQKEGYYRIWDCGHLKFIMRNNNDKN